MLGVSCESAIDDGVGEGGCAGSAHKDWGEVGVVDKWIEEGVGVGGGGSVSHVSLFVFVMVGVNGGEVAVRLSAVVAGVVGVNL